MIINPSSYTSAIPVALDANINIPGPIERTVGVTTSTTPTGTPNQLIDANANFIQTVDANGIITNQGVQVGQIVYNMLAMDTTSWGGPEAAEVLEVIDDNTLRLSADLFPFSGGVNQQAYKIYDANQAIPKAAILYVGGAGDLLVQTLDGQEVFIKGVVAGETLDLAIVRCLPGAAAANGQPGTETTASNITAFI